MRPLRQNSVVLLLLRKPPQTAWSAYLMVNPNQSLCIVDVSSLFALCEQQRSFTTKCGYHDIMSIWNSLGITPVIWCMFITAGVKALDNRLVSAHILEQRVNSLLQCIFHAYFYIVFLRRHKQLLQMIVVKDHCYCLCQFMTYSFLLVHIWDSAINPHCCKHPAKMITS